MDQHGPISEENAAPRVVDEVLYPTEIDIIEAALRETRLRSRIDFGQADSTVAKVAASPVTSSAQGSAKVPPGGGPGHGYSEGDLANVIAYGNQLRSWIDVQVDQRMDAWLARRAEDTSRAIAEVEALAMKESSRAIAGLQQTEFEVQTMKELQAKHFAVVESLSQEMLKVKSSCMAEDKELQARHFARVENLSQEVLRIKSSLTVEDKVALEALADDIGRLKKTVAACESAIKDVSAEARQAERSETLLAKRIEENSRAIVGLQQTEFDVQAMKELQAKHFAVVESLSEEMLKIKSSKMAEDKVPLAVAGIDTNRDGHDRPSEDVTDLSRRIVIRPLTEPVAARPNESRLDRRMWSPSQIVERETTASTNPIRIVSVSRSSSPPEPRVRSRESVYYPRWNIIGGRLISSEFDVDDSRSGDNVPFRSKLGIASRMEEDSRFGARFRVA